MKGLIALFLTPFHEPSVVRLVPCRKSTKLDLKKFTELVKDLP